MRLGDFDVGDAVDTRARKRRDVLAVVDGEVGLAVGLVGLVEAVPLVVAACTEFTSLILLRFVEERVATLQRGGVRDPLKALSLAALDIADELHRVREDRSLDEGEVGVRLRAGIAREGARDETGKVVAERDVVGEYGSPRGVRNRHPGAFGRRLAVP